MADSSLSQQLSISITQWHMPLFSLISGFSVCLSLQAKNSIRSYFSERFHKLVIPFLASEVFLVLPNSYLLARDYNGSYLTYFFVDFWKSYFAIYHLWWILYLLVISVLNICFFRWLVNINSFMKSEARLGHDSLRGSCKFIFIQTNVVFISCFAITKLSFPTPIIWHVIIVYGAFMYLPLLALNSADPQRNFPLSVFLAVIIFIASRMLVVSYYPIMEIPEDSLFSIITWGIHVVALNNFILLGFFIKLFQAELAAIIAKLHIHNWLPVTMLFIAPLLTFFTPQNLSSYNFDMRSYNEVTLAVGFELGQLLIMGALCLWAKQFCNEKLDPTWFDFLNQSAYPMYLSHNLWIYTISKTIKEWEISVFMKWVMVSGGALMCCQVFFMLISMSNLTRKLFGVPLRAPKTRPNESIIN